MRANTNRAKHNEWAYWAINNINNGAYNNEHIMDNGAYRGSD